MLATPWREPFSDPGWVFEAKWDGVRVVLGWDGTAVRAGSRTGKDLLPAFPELFAFRWPGPGMIDGEIVAFDATGVPSFELLQSRIGATGRQADALARSVPISVLAFDVLYDGTPLLTHPLEDRTARLAQIEPGLVVVSAQTVGDGVELFEAVRASAMEGVVAKRLGSGYRPGVRSYDWRKVAVINRLRAVMGGFLPGEGGRSSSFGSLVLGLFDGEALRYIGRVGTGFDDRALGAIRRALDDLQATRSPFDAADDPG
jgi:bifunctional non-homologous end joining protein LigD